MNRIISFLVILLLGHGATVPVVAFDNPPTEEAVKVAGKWNLSWQARLGTDQAVIELEQRGPTLNGSFHDAHHSCKVSGTIDGKNISFNVDFQEARPYTIAFKGVVEGDKITGISQAQNIGGAGAYLGHGGEIVQPEHPWTAVRPANPTRLRTQKAKTGINSSAN